MGKGKNEIFKKTPIDSLKMKIKEKTEEEEEEEEQQQQQQQLEEKMLKKKKKIFK